MLKVALKTSIRWVIRRDMQELLHIEQLSYPEPWNEEDFQAVLRQKNVIGLVACVEDRIVGYAIYELHRTLLHLVSIAVHPEYRRQRVGAQLIDKLIAKLVERRTRITLGIRERNLEGQLFFRDVGFIATGVDRLTFESTGEDAYLMEFRRGTIS